MGNAENDAKRILTHYFRQVYKKAGLGWDSDGDAEIGSVVDYIIDATCERMRRQSVDQMDRLLRCEQCEKTYTPAEACQVEQDEVCLYACPECGTFLRWEPMTVRELTRMVALVTRVGRRGYSAKPQDMTEEVSDE